MNIKSSKELQEAVDLAMSGNSEMLYDVARYIAYNYYIHTHIKAGTNEDCENDRIYQEFKTSHPDLYKEVEQIIDDIYKKL